MGEQGPADIQGTGSDLRTNSATDTNTAETTWPTGFSHQAAGKGLSFIFL